MLTAISTLAPILILRILNRNKSTLRHQENDGRKVKRVSGKNKSVALYAMANIWSHKVFKVIIAANATLNYFF